MVPEYAKGQINRIRNAVRKLDPFTEGHTEVDWDPWGSMGMRFLPVDNYVVYYLVDKENLVIKIVRIFYSGRDVEHIVEYGLK